MGGVGPLITRTMWAVLAASAFACAYPPAAPAGGDDVVFLDGFEPDPLDPCTYIPPPAGYSREVPPSRFPEVPLVVPLGFYMGDFPQSGGGQGRVTPQRNRYVSIRFVAPVDPAEYQNLARQFVWQEAQQGGLSVNLSAIYISVTQCPADFRIPPVSDTAPLEDPTYASGCRNWRPFVANGSPLFFRQIDYDLGPGPSNFDRCMIEPGGTYFFNFILASPVGGITPGENPCANAQSPSCGIQMSIQ